MVRPQTPSAPATPAVTGATIDERQVRAVITVTPATLRAGFQKAHDNLMAGIATRLVLRPGVYRADVSDLTWDTGRARDTLLVIAGTPGKTVWTGTDVFPLSTWKRQGDMLVHDWPYKFGNYSPPWGPKKVIAHRSELAFVGGVALRPEVLETYKVNGGTDPFAGGELTYDYTGLRDPAKTLTPGTFGVTERPENGGRVYLRLPPGTTPGEQGMEMAVRRQLVNFGAKHNLVVRGIAFVHCASPQPGYVTLCPMTFSAQGDSTPRNILLDDCRFLWNSGSGLNVTGQDWTIRNCVFDYNGFSGITAGVCRNILFEGNETSFNVWRAWRGGEIGWSYAGVKMHETTGQRVTHHLSVGNLTMGFWWDVHCHDITLQDSAFVANVGNGVMWELSAGPFYGRRLICAGGNSDFCSPLLMMNIGSGSVEDSIFYNDYPGGDKKNSSVTFASYTRDDPHAKREPITRGVYEVRRSLIVGGPRQEALVRAENWNAPADAMTPRGAGNIYYSPRGQQMFRTHLTAADDYSLKRFAVYRAMAGEAGSRWLDPKLRDPKHYDFRFAPDSPLRAEAARFPSYALPAAKQRELTAFWQWLRVTSPDGSGAPPADEP